MYEYENMHADTIRNLSAKSCPVEDIVGAS